jgi:hypothetical protein
LAVSPLEEQLISRRTSDGQSAEDERTGAESDVLVSLFAPDVDELNAVDLSLKLFRNQAPSIGRRVGKIDIRPSWGGHTGSGHLLQGCSLRTILRTIFAKWNVMIGCGTGSNP